MTAIVEPSGGKYVIACPELDLATEWDTPEAAFENLINMALDDAAQIIDAIEQHLQHDPTKERKSCIKRLRGISNPDYRLRVGNYRVFYVVDEDVRRVDVLRVMRKDQTLPYYKELQR